MTENADFVERLKKQKADAESTAFTEGKTCGVAWVQQGHADYAELKRLGDERDRNEHFDLLFADEVGGQPQDPAYEVAQIIAGDDEGVSHSNADNFWEGLLGDDAPRLSNSPLRGEFLRGLAWLHIIPLA